MQKKFIFSIIIIIVLLVVVFLSQQAYSGGIGKTFLSVATNQAGAYLAKGSNWVTSSIYPKISSLPARAGEAIQKRGDIVQNEVNQQKQNLIDTISKDIGTKVENYFSGVTNSIIHPGSPQNCPTPQTSGN